MFKFYVLYSASADKYYIGHCLRPRILGENSQNSLGRFPILRMSFLGIGTKMIF
jgi:hypothetical protein